MVTRAHLAMLKRLKRPEARRENGLYLVEGRRLVAEALHSGAPVREILATERFSRAEPGISLLRSLPSGVEVVQVAERDLVLIADTKSPQGILAVIEAGDSGRLDGNSPGVYLALNGVSDPGNVGTLVRAADAFSARAVLADEGCADFQNPKVLRAAMGSTFHLPLHAVSDLHDTLSEFERGGGEVWAAALCGEDVAGIKRLPRQVCLVLGNEARGASPAVMALARRQITIVTPGRAESLNVAMAGGILLAFLTRVGRGGE